MSRAERGREMSEQSRQPVGRRMPDILGTVAGRKHRQQSYLKEKDQRE